MTIVRKTLQPILACLALSLPVAAQGPDEIVVGASFPLTGNEAYSGQQYQDGYDLAFDMARAKGGLLVGGKRLPVELRASDDGSDPVRAAAILEQLVTHDKVNFLLSSYSTRLVEAQSAVAEKHHIPFVTGGADSRSLFQRGYRYLFGLQAAVDQLSFAEMRFLEAQQAAGKLPAHVRIVLLWEETGHGRDYRDAIVEYVGKTPARQAAFEIVLNEGFPLDQKSYKKLLEKVKAAGADIFLADTHQADFITMQREYNALGLCHALASYGARGAEKKAAQEIGPHGVDGLLSGTWWTAIAAGNEESRTFLEAFRMKYGREPEAYEAVGYEAARALFAGIEKAGSLDPDAVRAALASLEMTSLMPGGKLSFPADNGYQSRGIFVLLQNQPGGSPAAVYPRALARSEGSVTSCRSDVTAATGNR